MPARLPPYEGNYPRPKNFTYDQVIYDDGFIALIFGRYRRNPEPCLGIRWNSDEGPNGYPVSRGRRMWMVMPHKLALYMLEGIESRRSNGEEDNIQEPDQFDRALSILRGRP